MKLNLLFKILGPGVLCIDSIQLFPNNFDQNYEHELETFSDYLSRLGLKSFIAETYIHKLPAL